MADRHRNSLSLRERDTQVPSAGGTFSRFTNLKGSPELVATLPHLDSALRAVIEAISAWGTGLFSLACASQEAEVDRGYRCSGYVEFALNSRWDAQEATSYFPIFAGFDRWLRSHRFDRAGFDWEVGEAEFLDAGVSGFTCTVNVRTDVVEPAAAARADWEKALRILGQHLGMFRGPELDPIYEPPELPHLLAASVIPIELRSNGQPRPAS